MSTKAKVQALNEQIEKECPICQGELLLPTTVPKCGHKYCFTCLKSVICLKMSCPLCRGEIDRKVVENPSQSNMDLKMPCPKDYLEMVKPKKRARKNLSRRDVQTEADAPNNKKSRVSHLWVYQARCEGKWWRYDPRTEQDLEQAFMDNKSIIKMMICGREYIIDLEKMFQYPKGKGFGSNRLIQRVTDTDFDQLNVQGIAGISKQD